MPTLTRRRARWLARAGLDRWALRRWDRRHRLAAVALSLLLALVLGAVLLPHEGRQRPAPTAAELARSIMPRAAHASGMSVGGWLPYWDAGAGLSAATTTAKGALDTVHLFWFEAQGPSQIVSKGKQRSEVLTSLRRAGVERIATVTEQLDATAFAQLLDDGATRTTHVDALCKLANQDGWDGIDLDYERFAEGAPPAAVEHLAAAYVGFVRDVAECVHHHGKRLEVTVVARTTDDATAIDASMASGVFDYRALGAAADVVRPMAYDYHYSRSQPGAVAPIDWVQRVLRYTVERVPRSKIDLGLPLYGYDWRPSEGKGEAISAAGAPDLAARQGVAPARDPASASMVFRYERGGVAHEVWFDDDAATARRIGVAKAFGVHGVTFWALNQGAATLWR